MFFYVELVSRLENSIDLFNVILNVSTDAS